MDGLRLKGFRSLVDTGNLALKPITIIVGQNSSGKSTFLRTLPLIAQSISKRSNSPILWYGDFVDFGEIKDVISSFSKEKEITIEFEINSDLQLRRRVGAFRRRPITMEAFKIGITLTELQGKTALSGFSIESDSDRLYFEIKENLVRSINLNNRDVSNLLDNWEAEVNSYHLIPSITFSSTKEDAEDEFPAMYEPFLVPALMEASKVVQDALHKKTSAVTAKTLISRLEYQSEPEFTKSLNDVSELKTWLAFVSRMESPNARKQVEKIRELIFLAKLPLLLDFLQHRVSNLANGISYIGPARATSERYYRIRELAIDQIDPRGENLAMYLNSLSEADQEAFSQWVEESVGHAVKVIKSEGHIQLHLREKSSDIFHNLADTGYGFSQILPVLAQIWAVRRRRRPGSVGSASIVAIEQPELHLHPAYQGQLADVFVNALRSRGLGPSSSSFKFVIETHSEALINRLGELVYDKKIDADDISIFVFEKSSRSEETKVRVATFDAEGLLDNWPQGFFSRNS
jgi:predicted ATPase